MNTTKQTPWLMFFEGEFCGMIGTTEAKEEHERKTVSCSNKGMQYIPVALACSAPALLESLEEMAGTYKDIQEQEYSNDVDQNKDYHSGYHKAIALINKAKGL